MSTVSMTCNYISSCNSFSDEYELKHSIGQGVFSDVYLCVQRDNEQQYAAKVLKKNYGPTMDEARWKTISEVNVANALSEHPFILSISSAFHEQQTGTIILLSEVMNRSLYEIIVDGQCPLSDVRIKEYMYQMLEGLKYLHENGFIHRDIKPENILLKCSDKLLKIGDFGSTCSVTQEQQYTSYVATRWYRSPECLLTQGRYGTKMDIWAAGCVLYEMATGNALFDGINENDQIAKIDHVLGSPDVGLLNKFKKYKSDVFINRYGNKRDSEHTSIGGVGLHTIYQPFRPAYEILKEMIVYNPIKRFSADRLLRKPYFYKMKHTRYECKIKEFREKAYKKPIIYNSFAAGEKKTAPKKTIQSWHNKKGPSGDDRMSDLPTTISILHLKSSDTCTVNKMNSETENPGKEHLTTSSISTFGKVPMTKQIKKTIKNRPPFK